MSSPSDSECDKMKEDLSTFGLSLSDENIFERFFRLSTRYSLSPSSLVEKYVAFRHNRNLPDSICQTDVNLFENEVLLPLLGSNSSRFSEAQTIDSFNVLPNEMLNDILASQNFDQQKEIMSSYLGNSTTNAVLQPINVNVANDPSPSVKSSHRILCSFSNRIDGQQSQNSQPYLLHAFNWKIRPIVTHKMPCPKYMWQRSLAKANIIDSWAWDQVRHIIESLPASVIDNIETNLPQKSAFSLSSVLDSSIKQDDSDAKRSPVSILRPIHARLQTLSLVAGRVAVCPEAAAVKGTVQHQRLDTQSACIVGIKRAGGGDLGQIMLDVNTNASTLEYSLYPGQPVVLKATNVNGRCLTAFEFYWPKIPPPFEVKDEMLYPDLHVAVACGPYTTNTSHDNSPLLTLLKSIKTQRPHVLILLGPLVDSSHPLIGEYSDSTYDELYQSRLNTVAQWCYMLKVKVIVVSVWREVCESPVYPTPPAFASSKPPWVHKNTELASWYEGVMFVWDPSTIKIGPFCIGLSSPDVLFQMSSQEISANCRDDRLARLCRHVLSSGSYYPVHPPPEDLPLDYPLWWEYAQLPPDNSPHCVILPSRLRTFIKNVDGVICVNPGLTARPTSTSGGSYAQLIFSINLQIAQKDLTPATLAPLQVAVEGKVFQL